MKEKYISLLSLLIVIVLMVACGSATKSIKKAREALNRGEYELAADYYKKAYKRIPPKERKWRGEVAFAMGEAYYKYGNVARAIGAYKNAERYKYNDTLVFPVLGQLSAQMGNYKEAADYLSKHMSLTNDSSESKLNYYWAMRAVDFKNEGSAYTVKLERLFASSRSDFSPMYGNTDGDELYFTTTRNQATGDELSNITGMKNGDIFRVKKDERGKWKAPELVEGGLNTPLDEGACCFSPDGSKMYLTVCPTDPEFPRMAEIWVSNRSDASWSKPTKLKLTDDTLSSYAHPCVSTDGSWLYFTSDMPGGFGGYDLWRTRMDGSDIEVVENLGSSINTAGDEMFPTFKPTGELYFSSDGRGGLGGLDLFSALEDTVTHEWKVLHLPAPINSNGNDFGMTFEGFHNRGYFTSSRTTGGRGWDKIFSFSYPETTQTVKGWIYEVDGYELPEAVVYIVGSDGTNTKLGVLPDGSFETKVNPAVDYVFLASCNGYLNTNNQLTTDTISADRQYVLQFPLASVSVPVLVRNVFFEFDKADITPESATALNRLVLMLQDNPQITIELSAHTDSRGRDAYNQRLSQRRAESVVNYLIAQGIESERLTPVGYGETLPKVVNKKLTESHHFLKEGDVLTDDFIEKLTPEQQDSCHALNRRTQFRVLRTTYSPSKVADHSEESAEPTSGSNP